MSGRSAVSLYRAILRAHRTLPQEMRALGDAYVRKEFRDHRSAKAEQVARFLEGWEDYLQALNPGAAQRGRDLSAEELAALNPEQAEQLDKMRGSVAGGADHER